MRRRKWLWLGFAALCALAVAIDYLARSKEELAKVRTLRHAETLLAFQMALVSGGSSSSGQFER
jgi:hypothetical protein